jgi:hypothetical protein
MIEFKTQAVPEYTCIDRYVELAMKAEMLREEQYVRRHAKIFIDQGYRIGELQLLRKKMGKSPERDLLCLMPRVQIHPAVLEWRKVWRELFWPYLVTQ